MPFCGGVCIMGEISMDENLLALLRGEVKPALGLALRLSILWPSKAQWK